MAGRATVGSQHDIGFGDARLNKKQENKQGKNCDLCNRPGVEDARRDKFYKGVLIENLPAKHCPHCHEAYYNFETVGLMDKCQQA